MKKLSIIIIGLFVTLLTGCQSVVLKSPTELIRPPKLDVDQEEVRQVIEEMLPDKAELTSVIKREDIGAINFIDLDGDKIDEAVAFYKSQEKEYISGVLILKYGDLGWENFDEKNEIANDIDFVTFEDVTEDGNKDIIVGYVGDQDFDKYLVVYSSDIESKMVRVFEKSYDQAVIADFDYDKKMEIVLFQLNQNVSAQAQLYEFQNDEFYILDEYEINQYVSAYDNVAVGDLYKNDIGMVVDFRIGAHSAASILLKIENNRIINVLDSENQDYYTQTHYKPYFIESEDIDSDGIIEIGDFIEPIGYEDVSNLKVPYIEAWSTWDGDDKLVLDRESYSSYQYRYRFLFPIKWNEQVTIEKREIENTEDLTIIDYITEDGKKIIPIYSIRIYNNEKWHEIEPIIKKEYEKYKVLNKNINYTYVMIEELYDTKVTKYTKELEKMKLSDLEFENKFYFIK